MRATATGGRRRPDGADAVPIDGGDDRVLQIRGKDVSGWGTWEDCHRVAFALLGATIRGGHLANDRSSTARRTAA